MLTAAVLKALANDRRLQVLRWLRDPAGHFPPQPGGDPAVDGVCTDLIAAKLGVSQPTASEHLRVLAQAGLVESRRVRQWTFHRRNERRIDEVKRSFGTDW